MRQRSLRCTNKRAVSTPSDAVSSSLTSRAARPSASRPNHHDRSPRRGIALYSPGRGGGSASNSVSIGCLIRGPSSLDDNVGRHLTRYPDPKRRHVLGDELPAPLLFFEHIEAIDL